MCPCCREILNPARISDLMMNMGLYESRINTKCGINFKKLKFLICLTALKFSANLSLFISLIIYLLAFGQFFSLFRELLNPFLTV